MLPTYRTILCCHGLGPRASEVLAHAFGLAQTYDAAAVVAHATEPVNPQTQQMIESFLPSGKMEELRESAREKIIGEITDQVRELTGGVAPERLREVRVVDGRSADALLEVAREVGADLIVMGAHRHTTVGELLLGSTAHRVVHNAPVPVLLVRLAD